MTKNLTLTPLETFVYFRLGLVTGLVAIEEIVAWADQQLLEGETSEEVIELSFVGKRSLSEVVWLLGSFVVSPEYDKPLKVLFARAGRAAKSAPETVQALQLLLAEEHLPSEIRTQLEQLSAQRLVEFLTSHI